MRTNKPPSDDVLYQAAELRAGGSTWEAVAIELHRSAETVRRWPRQYGDRWAIALRDAERRSICDAAAESVLVLRKLLRSDDEKVRRDAARSLTELRLDVSKLNDTSDSNSPATAPSPEAARILAFLDGHPDVELAQLAANVLPAQSTPRSFCPEPCPVDGAA